MAAIRTLDDLDENESVSLVFADPSTNNDALGWPLRNLLALIAYQR